MVQPYLSPDILPAHQLTQLSVRQNLPNVDWQHIHLEGEKQVNQRTIRNSTTCSQV